MDFCKSKNIRVTMYLIMGLMVSESTLAFYFQFLGLGFYNWVSQNINDGAIKYSKILEEFLFNQNNWNRDRSFLKRLFAGFNISFYNFIKFRFEKIIRVNKPKI